MRSRPQPARFIAGMIFLTMLPSTAAPVATAADAPAKPVAPAAKADSVEAALAAALRAKWEPIVELYGQEETNQFSLRVLDKNAKETGVVAFKECWKYDRQSKAWAKLEVKPVDPVKIVPADKKPQTENPDSQLIVDLPIKLQDVGLYYIKWTVDDVPGVTYARLGPPARNRKPPPAKPRPGEKLEDVPVDVNTAEMAVIPDPTYHTGEGSKALPATRAK